MNLDDFKTEKKAISLTSFEQYKKKEVFSIDKKTEDIANSIYEISQQVPIQAILNPKSNKFTIIDGEVRFNSILFLNGNTEDYKDFELNEITTIFKSPRNQEEYDFLLSNWKNGNSPRKEI